MSLQTLSYEEIIQEACTKQGALRGKKNMRLHVIEEFAAQQLIVLPIVTSPSPLSPAKTNKPLFLVRFQVFLTACVYCYFEEKRGAFAVCADRI